MYNSIRKIQNEQIFNTLIDCKGIIVELYLKSDHDNYITK